jgi:transposase
VYNKATGGAFSMSGKKGMKRYPKAVKLEAIRLFYEGGLTRREIEEKLGLSKGRVKIWLRIYRREGEAGLQKPRRGRRPKAENTEAYIRPSGDGERPTKKAARRVASGQAHETQYRIIHENRERYEVTAMCDFFGISRAAYYKWVKRSEEPDPDLGRMQLVEKAWLKSRKTYGYRRVALYLQQQGHVINHKTVLRLMRKLHIRSVARKRKPYKKASEMETHHRYENILNRDFTVEEPNRKWVTDISYIATRKDGLISPRSKTFSMASLSLIG